MRNRLRRTTATIGLLGIVTAGLLTASIGSSGTAHAAVCETELIIMEIESGIGDVVFYQATTCTSNGRTWTTWRVLN